MSLSNAYLNEFYVGPDALLCIVEKVCSYMHVDVMSCLSFLCGNVCNTHVHVCLLPCLYRVSAKYVIFWRLISNLKETCISVTVTKCV